MKRVAAIPTILVVAVLAGVRLPAADVLIEVGDMWKFCRGKDPAPAWFTPPSTWRQIEFDDGTANGWEEGPSGFGYGDNGNANAQIATPITDMQNVYRAVYTRKAFNVADRAAITSLHLVIDYDDGFVAYLNGKEVARRHHGNVGQDFAWNESTHGDAREAGTPERINLSTHIGDLVDGKNVLAVEIRNQSNTSSDLCLVPRLVANDAALSCPDNFTCPWDQAQSRINLAWRNNSVTYDQIAITRNGVAIAGSPFPGSATTATDATPGNLDVTYELIATEGSPCAPVACASTVQSRGQGTLHCVLSLENGSTKATLTWTNIPDTVKAEISREEVLKVTLLAGETLYTDPDVESDQPEENTRFQVKLFDVSGRTATMTCGGNIPLCPTLACAIANIGGKDRVRLTFGNLVKEWTTFTIQRTDPGAAGPVILTDTLPGTATEFVDDVNDFSPEPGFQYVYTLHPVATVNPVTTCDRTCTVIVPAPEIADYDAPAGGWDYAIDFESLATLQYNGTTGLLGNLDGRWIRSVDRDFWGGFGPDDVGTAPAGPAPGGMDVISRPGLGPCGEDIKSLRILDPGDPSNPGTSSLAGTYPDAFTDPSNKAIFLGVDAGVSDKNLLQEGVTFAARWRLDPDTMPYMAAGADGDGEDLVDGALGNIGFHFRNNNNALAGAGPNASASFSFNSGNVLRFSSNPAVTLPSAAARTYRSLWVTVEDPEKDGTYDVKAYTNGRTRLFGFATGLAVALDGTTFNFGAEVANYLAIGLPDIGNDGIIEIDYIAYKKGVHLPVSIPCSPVTNNLPHARIAVTPPTGQVLLAGGAGQATLNGSASDDGDNGTQGLSYAWSKVSGPASGDTIVSPSAVSTQVNFTAEGVFVYRLTVNDGQLVQNIATAEVTITVTRSGGGPVFKRGDVDGDGAVNITDVIAFLGWNFRGDPPTLVCPDSADADDSGDLTVTDAIVTLGWQFRGDPQDLPFPGPDSCGSDGPSTPAMPDCNYLLKSCQ